MTTQEETHCSDDYAVGKYLCGAQINDFFS
jgi:hypothetical protein